MLFANAAFATRAAERIKALPPVPASDWQRPREFPELRGSVCIGVDVETRELDFDHGPGWARGTGSICGVSIAALRPDGSSGKWYFPVRHTVEPEHNFAPKQVFGWLKEQLETSIPKVGANLIYDTGYLADENIWMQGPLYDVQFAEAILYDQNRVALDTLGRRWLGVGKTTDLLKEWIFRAYPKSNETNWRGNIYRSPASLVGHYAEDDAFLPIAILFKQWAKLEELGQLDLFKMECSSIPMLVQMRRPGLTIDVDAAIRLKGRIEAKLPTIYDEIHRLSGVRMDKVMAAEQCAQVFTASGIPHNGTFRKEAMKLLAAEHPVVQCILDAREHEKVHSTFLTSYILERHQNGKIYPTFHPLKGDTNGAKTGRYASSDPNIQNVSVRSALGREIRELVIPDHGHVKWHKKDHSQIEYRFFAHYAVGDGSDAIRSRYNNDPKTDYHQDTMDDVAPRLGYDLKSMSKEAIETFRRPVKNINFGLLYGQSEKSLAYKSGMSPDQAKIFFEAYHSGRPFVRSTMEEIMRRVSTYGYSETVLGRRNYFTEWEPMDWEQRKQGYRGTFDIMAAMFGANIQVAYAYRGVNYTFQGSAADALKRGMLDCYESGVFHYVGMPKIQVHDELGFSLRDESPAMIDALKYIDHRLETALKLKVPLRVDSKSGDNWRQCG